MDRRSKAAAQSLTFLAIIAGVLIALNVVGVFAFARFDATKKELFSLSEGSKRVARSLTDKLEIVAYFTEDLPPPANATERYVRDLLSEYAAASKGKIEVTFISPDDEEEKEAAQEDGIPMVQHQVFEDDGVSVREGYRGIVMRYLNKKESIPAVPIETTGLEYDLTMKLKKLTGDKTKVGILTGFEGPKLGEELSMLRTCLPTYEVSEISVDDLDARTNKAALIVGPTTPIDEASLRKINKYVMEGGSLGVFGGIEKINLEGMGPSATSANTGLEKLLEPWGISFENGIVADAQCGRAPMRTQFGTVGVPHPPVPTLMFDEKQTEHPALFRLDWVSFPFTGALKVDEKSEYAKALATSSEQSWLMTGESISLAPKQPQEWRKEGPDGPFAVIAAAEGKLPSAFPNNQSSASGDFGISAPDQAKDGARVLVAGSSFVLRNEVMPPSQDGSCRMSNNVALALNAIDWLAQESDLIEIRAKNIEDPRIEVPQNVLSAEEDKKEAQVEAEAAQMQGLQAQMQGDQQGAAQASAKIEEASEKQEQAMRKEKEARDTWQSKKDAYKWGNILGIPAIFALFGFLRWRSRQSRRKNMKLD